MISEENLPETNISLWFQDGGQNFNIDVIRTGRVCFSKSIFRSFFAGLEKRNLDIQIYRILQRMQHRGLCNDNNTEDNAQINSYNYHWAVDDRLTWRYTFDNLHRSAMELVPGPFLDNVVFRGKGFCNDHCDIAESWGNCARIGL